MTLMSNDWTPRRHKARDSWVAPEHGKVARSMKRDYIRDDFGRPVLPKKRELVVDARPQVMKEEEEIRRKYLIS